MSEEFSEGADASLKISLDDIAFHYRIGFGSVEIVAADEKNPEDIGGNQVGFAGWVIISAIGADAIAGAPNLITDAFPIT